MIDSLKPYSEYKPTTSRWLKSIPMHWGVQSLRTLIQPRAERNRPDLPLLSVARERGVFVRSLIDQDENHNVIPEDLSNYKVARKGNLVINKMKAWQGSMGIAPCDGIVSPAYYVFDLSISNGIFAQLMFRSKPYVAHFGQASDGVRIGQWDLSIPGMREIPVLLPPPDEQAAIVRFLDHANGKIERAIRAKRKLIALLNEQKQAIIHRAVTRGLDPNVKLKPSGIPWLGDVPEHWEVRRISYLFDERNERGRIGIPILVVSLRTGVTEGSDIDEDGREKRLIADVTKYKFADKGDIAYNMMRMWQGAVGVVPVPGMVSPAYVVAKPRHEVWSAYFDYLFHTDDCKNEVNRHSRGIVTDRNRLYWDQFKRLYFPLPPYTEQEAITAWIKSETASLDVAINQTEREIELLREYRTTLTAEVVTGKLDVREAEKRLPDKADASHPTEDAIIEPDEEDALEAAEADA